MKFGAVLAIVHLLAPTDAFVTVFNPLVLKSSSITTSSCPEQCRVVSTTYRFSATMGNEGDSNAKLFLDDLSGLLDKYIISGSPRIRDQVEDAFGKIADTREKELVEQSIRMIKRAGVPVNWTKLEKRAAVSQKSSQTTREIGENVASSLSGGKSALSRRNKNGKPDIFMKSILGSTPLENMAQQKQDLQKELGSESQSADTPVAPSLDRPAAQRVAEMIAQAGAGASFEGENIGIGGLDEVLAQVKRRVWTPLAAPPQLLAELGIHPVRGLLLYGKPGCGKTLLARTLGKVLSPMRPITVVSGPEIMDKFVGSSEQNLREVFDNPPDIYESYRIGEADGGDSIANAALHVVVMDEFDAVGRTRGGKGGKGDQGDAGVARDSVVNQLLAKMDGVHPLPVPTLVVGLTNKRSLIEPALLRPGRFEVQIEVPPPRSLEQRVSVLRVHTQNMNAAGRLLVSDPPTGTAAAAHESIGQPNLLPYEELLTDIGRQCDGFSGAALAGVARAAASHALERAVNEFSEQGATTPTGRPRSIMDCLVTPIDFKYAIDDVRNSMGTTDHSDDEVSPNGDGETTATSDGKTE
eukprot:Nitzschia sp. Nitz4//scaffold76_size158648//137301//139346//NITZ4_002568-RA/size158648-augustus-gene-0.153-mRNA-1//-1//CDS//3329557911//8719//frame0